MRASSDEVRLKADCGSWLASAGEALKICDKMTRRSISPGTTFSPVRITVKVLRPVLLDRLLPVDYTICQKIGCNADPLRQLIFKDVEQEE